MIFKAMACIALVVMLCSCGPETDLEWAQYYVTDYSNVSHEVYRENVPMKALAGNEDVALWVFDKNGVMEGEDIFVVKFFIERKFKKIRMVEFMGKYIEWDANSGKTVEINGRRYPAPYEEALYKSLMKDVLESGLAADLDVDVLFKWIDDHLNQGGIHHTSINGHQCSFFNRIDYTGLQIFRISIY